MLDQYKLENITQGPKVTSMADRLLMNLFNYASEID